jgi:hypothetical protein
MHTSVGWVPASPGRSGYQNPPRTYPELGPISRTGQELELGFWNQVGIGTGFGAQFWNQAGIGFGAWFWN